MVDAVNFSTDGLTLNAEGMNPRRRELLERIRIQMEYERSTFVSHWYDLGRFIYPRGPRFWITDVDRGDRRNQNIIDSTATLAARTLRAGMMSGVTSPARPWFRLTTFDPNMAEQAPVKEWLDEVTQRLTDIFLRSNLYNSLPILYGDMGVFATGAMWIEEDFEQVIRTYPLAIGSYCLGNDARLKVGLFYREFRLTIRQCVEKFDDSPPGAKEPNWGIFSHMVKALWLAGTREAWVDISHIVMPNPDYDPRKFGSRYGKFRSIYYERGATPNTTLNYMQNEGSKILSDKGYDYFPALVGRWEVNAEDIYGTTCPGMDALGDIRQLQVGEKRGAQAIEKMVNPPMTAPTSLRNQKASILPGDITYVDAREGQQGFRPAHDLEFKLEALENKQQMIRQRISRAFFEDLFLMLANSDRREITAREIDERHEEKLLALGPVLEQLNQDVLDPLIDITFRIAHRQRLIPPPPPQMANMPLKVVYVSIMAQAQKLLGIASIERFSGFVGQLVQATNNPEIIDKVNTDALVDKYADDTSMPAGIIRDEEQVAAIRQQRMQQQQAAAKAQQAQQGADAAAKLSKADMSGDNALTRMVQTAQAGSSVPQR